MELKVNLDEEKIGKLLTESIDQSDIFQDTVETILEEDEIKQIIKYKIIDILNSPEGTEMIKKIFNEYMDSNFNLEDYNNIMETLVDSVNKLIKSKLNTRQGQNG